jgi:hypothetical protein
MIKKYKLFLESNVSFEDEYESFKENLEGCIDHYKDIAGDKDFAFDHCYSYTAQDGREYLDPDADYEKIKDYMSDHGWPESRVKHLIENLPNFNKRVIRDNPGACAASDVYLYNITKKQFPLQGFDWGVEMTDRDLSEMSIDEMNEDELMIRFRYGWHKTKYGKLVIEQNLGSISEFIKLCYQGIIPSTISDMIYFIQRAKKIRPTIDDEDVKPFQQFFISDDEHYEIYIDTESLKEEVDKKYNSKDLFPTQEEFDAFIKNIFESNKLKVRVVVPGDMKVSV